MRSATLNLSFLILGMTIVACGTTEEFVPPTDTVEDGDTASDADATDTNPDSDTDSGPAECVGPNPAVSCRDTGCPSGEVCVLVEGGCAPSMCTCEDGSWQCTADCGPEYVCEDEVVGECPVTEPAFGSTCSSEALECFWGQECCCGECYPSIGCMCTDGEWQCWATDACMIPGCAGQACEDDTDCESFGEPAICVGGTCTGIGPESGWTVGPVLEPMTNCDSTASDYFQIESAAIDGDAVALTVGYSGGCAEHRFRVCWEGVFAESEPPQVMLTLQHDDGGDMCEAWPTTELEIPLGGVADAFREAFEHGGTLVVNVGETALEYEVAAP
jgi:hypothetical protein